MTPGIASSRAELSCPLLSFHHIFCLPEPSLTLALLFLSALLFSFVQSNSSLHLSVCFLLTLRLLSLTRRPPLSSPHSPLVHPLPSSSHFSLCHVLRRRLRPILFFLAFNLLFYNYMSSMTDQQRLVLQGEKKGAEIQFTKSLYAQQASLTIGIPAVRGIGNPALCALSSLQSSPVAPQTLIMLHVHIQYPCCRYTVYVDI